MKQRIISAIVMIAICVPLLILGGLPFTLGVFLISIFALKEFIDMKETKKKVPTFIKCMSYIFLVTIMGVNVSTSLLTFMIDYRVISGLFLAFFIPCILYHDREKFSINDAFYLIGGIFFLAQSMTLLIGIREYGLYILIYLLLITIMTDTFAYLTGMLIGKHKLLEEISPKKTIEGTIGGTVMGVFVSTVFYMTVINPSISIIVITLVGLFLSVLGQFGDLFFSAIKRYFGKKDFSNLIPGHGGILDRLDSIIFVLLGFMFFISLI